MDPTHSTTGLERFQTQDRQLLFQNQKQKETTHMTTRNLIKKILASPKGSTIKINRKDREKFQTYIRGRKLRSHVQVINNELFKLTNDNPGIGLKRRAWLDELRDLNLEMGETKVLQLTKEEHQRFQITSYKTSEYIVYKGTKGTVIQRISKSE